MYDTMNFDKCTQLCNHLHTHDLHLVYHLLKFLLALRTYTSLHSQLLATTPQSTLHMILPIILHSVTLTPERLFSKEIRDQMKFHLQEVKKKERQLNDPLHLPPSYLFFLFVTTQ